MSEEKSAVVAILKGLGNIKIRCDWNHRIRDGFLYSMASGFTFLLLYYSGIFGVILIFVWWFFTVQAIKRLFPDFFGDIEYTVYKLKKEEDKREEMVKLGDAVANEMPPAQISTKRQPTQKEFWDAARAAHGPDAATKASMSLPRIVPVSYPKQANESAEKQTRSRMLREVLTEVSKPLPVAITLDGLLPSQEALIEISVVKEKWQPLVDFAKNAKQQAKSCCDLKLLQQVRGISVNCDLKLLLQPVCGISVIGDVSFVMEFQCKYGPIDFDGFCDAIALKDGARLPFEQGLHFEPSLDGALAAFFIQVVLPGHWAWGHGMYDRDQQLVTTLDAAIAILQQSGISAENSELRKLTIPPGIRVSRSDDTIEVSCLAYRPGKGFSDIVVTIEGGQLSNTRERVLFHWGQGILY